MSILVSCHCCRARDSLCSGIRAGRFWFLNASPPFKLDALISFLFCPKFPSTVQCSCFTAVASGFGGG